MLVVGAILVAAGLGPFSTVAVGTGHLIASVFMVVLGVGDAGGPGTTNTGADRR